MAYAGMILLFDRPMTKKNRNDASARNAIPHCSRNAIAHHCVTHHASTSR